jgi:hypothetical protein
VNEIITFFNHHSVAPVPYISTDEELQSFFDVAGFGLLCAFTNASDETLPQLATMHQDHFNEITIAYCDPGLTKREAFFVYRHTDNSLVELQRSLFDESIEEVERILSPYAIPDVIKADHRLAEMYSGLVGFLALATEQEFYLRPQQLHLAKEIKARCGIPLFYELSMFPSLSSIRYGFPATVNSGQLRIIDFSDRERVKYLLDGPLTPESADDFCFNIKKGQVKRFWKSAPIPTRIDHIVQTFVADNILQEVREGVTVVALYWHDKECLRPFISAVVQIVKAGYNFKAAEFGLAHNDWPGPNTTMVELPRLLTFRDGELLTNLRSGNTTELVMEQMLEQFKIAKLDKDL